MPLMNDARSDVKNSTASAISIIVPSRPSGVDSTSPYFSGWASYPPRPLRAVDQTWRERHDAGPSLAPPRRVALAHPDDPELGELIGRPGSYFTIVGRPHPGDPVRRQRIVKDGREGLRGRVPVTSERRDEDCGSPRARQGEELGRDQRRAQQVHPEDGGGVGHAGGEPDHVGQNPDRAGIVRRRGQLSHGRFIGHVAAHCQSVMALGPKVAYLTIEVLFIQVCDQDAMGIAEPPGDRHREAAGANYDCEGLSGADIRSDGACHWHRLLVATSKGRHTRGREPERVVRRRRGAQRSTAKSGQLNGDG